MIRVVGEKIFMALCIAYVVLSFGIYAGTKAEEVVQEGHKDRHHEKDIHLRTKRYALARVPLSYSPRFGLDNTEVEMGDEDNIHEMAKRYSSIRTNPAASHFRELQPRQRRRPSVVDGMPTAEQLNTYRNLMQYYGLPSDNGVDLLSQSPGGIPADEVSPMTDEELQTLLLLLGGYRLSGDPSQSRSFYTSPAQYYIPGEDGPILGKRETGKRGVRRSKAQLEQPMSFENSVNSDGGAVFIGQKRSKRVGDIPTIQAKHSSSIRIKKQTDPAVEATLDKVFSGIDKAAAEQNSAKTQSIQTTAVSSSNHQIPPPSSFIQKKAINWSEYFGIDKRMEQKEEVNDKHASTSSLSTTAPAGGDSTTSADHNINEASPKKSKPALPQSPSLDGEEKSDKHKEKKDKTRLENDTEEKDDRKWILKEFYKNLAMSTNVRKRKRESPSDAKEKELEKLEKIERKMEEAGDKIIWDTLKYTGAHRDAQLTPEELARVKSEIIQKLSAAYSLEKVREAIDGFRQELAELKDKQQHY